MSIFPVGGGLLFGYPFSATTSRDGIEPSVCFAVIRQPRDVPMADERGVSLPHRRAAAHEYYGVGKPGEQLFGMLLRADFQMVRSS